MSRDATGVWSGRAKAEMACPACGVKVGEDCEDTQLGDWEHGVHTRRLAALTDMLNEQHHRPSRRLRTANIGWAVGTELRRLRDDVGLTQRVVAERAGILRPIYARLERGEHEPKLSTLLLVIVCMQGDAQRIMQDVLRRAAPTRAVYPGFRCADCTYYPLDAHTDQTTDCEHPSFLPARSTPRRHLPVTGDRSPPTDCPLRKAAKP